MNTLYYKRPCFECAGTGQVHTMGLEPCPYCFGNGFTIREANTRMIAVGLYNQLKVEVDKYLRIHLKVR